MKEIICPIPNKYFLACRVIKPFHCEVRYKVNLGIVEIYDVAFSEGCLLHISNTAGLVDDIKVYINKVEGISMHPVFQSALAPFINH